MVKKLMRPLGSNISATHPVFLESLSSYSLNALHRPVGVPSINSSLTCKCTFRTHAARRV